MAKADKRNLARDPRLGRALTQLAWEASHRDAHWNRLRETAESIREHASAEVLTCLRDALRLALLRGCACKRLQAHLETVRVQAESREAIRDLLTTMESILDILAEALVEENLESATQRLLAATEGADRWLEEMAAFVEQCGQFDPKRQTPLGMEIPEAVAALFQEVETPLAGYEARLGALREELHDLCATFRVKPPREEWDDAELDRRYRGDLESGMDYLRDGDQRQATRRLLAATATQALFAMRAPDAKARMIRLRTAENLLTAAEGLARRQGRPKDAAPTATANPTGPASEKRDGANREADPEPQAFAARTIHDDSPGFESIAGLASVKEQLRLRMIYPFTHAEAAARYNLRPGGGVLLFGPPGTGKTMIARATAKELGAAFFVVKPSEILSKWVGEAEQNVAALFRAAHQHERAVIFLDEIEALLPARGDGGGSVMQRVVPQFLAELDGFDRAARRPLLFLGATNEPWSLDPAVLRPGRFDVRLLVDLPDAAARRWLLEEHLRTRPVAPGLDLTRLADRLEGYSGADLAALCETAAQQAFLASVEGGADRIDAALLERVLATMRPSVPPEARARYQAFQSHG